MDNHTAIRRHHHSRTPKFVSPLVLAVEGLLLMFLFAATARNETAVGQTVVSSTLPLLTAAKWEDDYQGKRYLTLHPNGTGMMVVQLSGIPSMLFGRTLTFFETWSIDDDIITMNATGGEPAGKVNLVLKTFGTRASYRIESLTADQLVLIDLADDARYEWRRVAEADSGT